MTKPNATTCRSCSDLRRSFNSRSNGFSKLSWFFAVRETEALDTCDNLVCEFQNFWMEDDFAAVIAIRQHDQTRSCFKAGERQRSKAVLPSRVDEQVPVRAFLDSPTQAPGSAAVNLPVLR